MNIQDKNTSKQRHSHIVYLNPNIADPALSIIGQFCAKDSNGKPILSFICKEIDDKHPFYLQITACYNNCGNKKFLIPNSLVLLIHENPEELEESSFPFGIVPPS